MMMGLFAGNSNQRIEFVRMKGPQGKGHAEMAVTKPKGKENECLYRNKRKDRHTNSLKIAPRNYFEYSLTSLTKQLTTYLFT